MCISCQKSYQTIVLMMSPDNPNRICKPDSTCYCFWYSLFVMLVIIFIGVIFYFATIGLGYGMTYIAVSDIYNMTTGYKHGSNSCPTNNAYLICSHDGGSGFYGGCFLIGLICDMILGILVICGLILYRCWTICIHQCVSNMRSEITSSFESAKNMGDKYVADPDPNPVDPVDRINFTTTSDEVIELEE